MRKRTIKVIMLFLFFGFVIPLKAQWSKTSFSGSGLTYSHTLQMNGQGKDTIFCIKNSSAGGNPQGIFYSTNGGKNFTHLYDLLLVWGWIQHTRFIHKDTLLIVTSNGVIKKSLNFQELPFFVFEYKEYESGAVNIAASTHFWDASNGIIASRNTFRTYDGGKNWSLVVSPNKTKGEGTDLLYIPSSKRFIVHNSINIFESKNFGSTWEEVANLRSVLPNLTFIEDISFPNDSIGYLIAGSAIYITTDSGKTWSRKNNGSLTLMSMVFADIDNGFLLIDKQKPIYKVLDNGAKLGIEFTFDEAPSIFDKFFYIHDSAFFLSRDKDVYIRKKLSLGIEENKEMGATQTISLYPNPFTESFTIDIPFGFESKGVILKLYNSLGTLVHSQVNATHADVGFLPPGLYMATFGMDGKILGSQKIIKQ